MRAGDQVGGAVGGGTEEGEGHGGFVEVVRPCAGGEGGEGEGRLGRLGGVDAMPLADLGE